MILPGERAGHAAPPEIAARREAMAGTLAGGAWVTDPSPLASHAGGVGVLRWNGVGPSRGRVIHFHGGGYRLGCPEMEGPFAMALARACHVGVTVPRYRLAPEAPFPAALHDAMAVLEATPEDLPLFLSGGSAGGGLAAALALLAREQGRPIAGLMLHSPWLDLSVTAPSYAANGASDPLFSAESARQAAQLYLQGHSPADPLASPLLADPAGLPPVLISVGTGEVLLDDARRFAARLEAAEVPVTLLAIDGMDHVAVTRAMTATGAAETMAATADFLNRQLDQADQSGT